MKTCLVSYSGGVDSTAVAWELMKRGYIVELGYLRWDIAGSPFGAKQHEAATKVAAALDLTLIELGHVTVPKWNPCRFSWVQCAIAMTFWQAAYPVKNYDAVAFGFHEATAEGYVYVGEGAYVAGGYGDTFQADMFPHFIPASSHAVRYDGEILYPLAGKTRAECWDLLPDELKPLVWGCNVPKPDGSRCGRCFKCKYDNHQELAQP